MARSVGDIDELLCTPGERFEIKVVEVAGRPTRAWKHAPRSLGDLLDRGAEIGGDRDFLVLGDERLTHREHRDRALSLAAAPVDDVTPDDLATILDAAGTTSHPKGVLGTHRDICANVLSMEFVAARGMTRAGLEPPLPEMPRAVTLMPVPLFHGTGLHSNLA